MLSVKDQEILSLVPDYCIHLITPASLSDEEINKFSTNLREVLLFIKYSKDKKKLAELLVHDSRFKSIDRKAARVMNTVANLKLNLNESEGAMDMCQAIEEMISGARTEGEKCGEKRGFAQGRDNKGIQVFLNCKNRGMSNEEAQAIADISDKLVEIALEQNLCK
jgi:DNA-directed RNA polymerase subunit F